MNNLLEYLKPKVIDFVNSNTDECLPFPTTDSDGYGHIQYSINNKHGHARAHRIVYQIKHNVILSNDKILLHSCDNPACCNPRHLSSGTNKDNSDDKVSKGRQAKGKSNGRYTHGFYSKHDPRQKQIPLFKELYGRSLDIEKVISVKKAIINSNGKPLTQISKELNIKYQTVKDIYYGRSYRKIKI